MVNSAYEFLTVFIVVMRFPVESVNKKRLERSESKGYQEVLGVSAAAVSSGEGEGWKKNQDWARGFVLKWNSVLIDVYLRHGIKLVAYLLEFKSGVILSFRSRKSRWSNGFSFTDIPETRGCDLILVSAFQNTMFNMWISLLKSWQTANGDAVRGVKVFLFWPFRDESEPESELDVCSAINHPTLRPWERNEGVGLLFSFLKSMCICVVSRHPHRKSCPLCWLQNNMYANFE